MPLASLGILSRGCNYYYTDDSHQYLQHNLSSYYFNITYFNFICILDFIAYHSDMFIVSPFLYLCNVWPV